MMKLFNREIRQEIWYTIRTNKRRTLVTSLGVFAGMFFFTLLTGLGTGMENSIKSNLEAGASEMQMIFGARTTLPYEGYKANRQITTTYGDYLALKREADLIEHMEGVGTFGDASDSGWDNVQVVANGKSFQKTVRGVSEGYFPNITQIIIVAGRAMHPQEISRGENVCVIGTNVSYDYFDSYEEAIGQYMTISGLTFKIVGVMEPYSDHMNIGFSPKYSITIPLVFSVKNDVNAFCMLPFVRKEGVTPEEAADQMRSILAKRHHVDPTDTKAFAVVSMQMITQIFEMIQNVINVLVWVIGLGTLFSGVISVSNILLVTVRERQREIGVRRAIGAKPADIRLQFLMEAVLIIVIAGLVGILLALGVTLVIGSLAEVTPMGSFIERPYPSIGMMILSVVIMILSGVLAGLLPVYKALQIKAIDAIRDE